MSTLWKEESAEVWTQQLARESAIVEASGKERLADLERWWREELGPELCARQPRHMRAAELVKLVEWKLVRGKWRPKLLNYAKEHAEDAVVAASTEALQQLGQGDVKAALLRLCELKGVGVATASAVLACVDECCPFMSDEALAAALPGEKKYTLPRYLQLRAALQARAEQLSVQCQDDGLSPAQLERALWLHALENAPKKKPASKQAGGQAGRKRKRR